MKSNHGFTLIEVLVAMIILSVGLVGILGMSSYTLRTARDNDQWTTARMLAQSQLELLSAQSQTDLFNAPPTGQETLELNFQNYQIGWVVNAGVNENDPIEIRVRVAYPGFIQWEQDGGAWNMTTENAAGNVVQNNWVELRTLRTFWL
jgi:type IV pilus modification protein PilV